MKTIFKLVLFLLCAGAALVWIAGKVKRHELADNTPAVDEIPATTSPSASTPEVDCSLQPGRERLLANLIKENVLEKYDVANSVCHVWIAAKFYGLTFEDKQRFIAVAAAWAQCVDAQCKVTVLKDNRSGKEVGRFGAVYGGLKMD